MGQGMPPVWSFVLFALAFTVFFILGLATSGALSG